MVSLSVLCGVWVGTKFARPLVEKLLANDWQEAEFLELAQAAGLVPSEG